MSNTTKFAVVEAKQLASALKIANAIVELRNTLPILNDVRLTYGPKGLKVESTDLDLQAMIDVDEVDGDGSWSLCVPARHLASVAAAAGTGNIRIEPKHDLITNDKTSAHRIEYTAEITAGDATYTIQAHDPEDFPTIIGDRGHRIERFTNGQFAGALKKVSCCISTEETRYYLNGVNWASNESGRRFAATDGHRLALCRYAGDEGQQFSYIIPRKTVAVITQFLAAADLEVFAIAKGNEISETLLDFSAPGISLRSKLIDGTYPDIERVIPKEASHQVEVNSTEMLSAIRQATAIGGWRGSAIRLHGVAGRLSVELKNADLGTAKVATTSAWPEDLDAIGVNSRYMTDMVKRCNGAIILNFSAGGGPLTLNDEDPEMTRILMPMRI